MINNRQAGRRRGRGGQQQRPQGTGRVDNGNRIDNRARGNAAQLLEKYKTLARDAQMQGDRVNVEYYLQFADHYFRVLAETRSRLEENGGQPQGRRPQGATLDEEEQDYEDEGERAPQNEQRGGGEGNSGAGSGYRQDAERERGGNPQYAGNGGNGGNSGNGGDRGQREDRGTREDRGNRANANGYTNASGYAGGGEYRDGQQARPPRDDRDGPRAPRPERAESRPERAEPRFEPAQVPTQDEPAPLAVADAGVAGAAPVAAAVEAPRRGRGRPRREVPVESQREASSEEPLPFDGDRLPPSLGVSAIVADDAAEAPVEDKPRRRRGRPPAAVAAD